MNENFVFIAVNLIKSINSDVSRPCQFGDIVELGTVRTACNLNFELYIFFYISQSTFFIIQFLFDLIFLF